MFDDNKVQVGRISGIPIFIDMSLILLIVLYGSHYFTSGSPERMVQGVFIIAGIIGSILLHELAHAWAGRIVRCEATHIELNGMGGLCYFGRARLNRTDDIFVTLAGPAANLALWALFHWLGVALIWGSYRWFADASGDLPENDAMMHTIWAVQSVLSTIATMNMVMFVFNLMPSFPLDGGTALAGFLSRRMGNAQAVTTVAALGMIVCALCVYWGLQGNWFMFVIAYSLFMANEQQARVHGRQTWTRWN